MRYGLPPSVTWPVCCLLLGHALAAPSAAKGSLPRDRSATTWTTYRDEKLGFSLRHPKDWKITEKDPSGAPITDGVLLSLPPVAAGKDDDGSPLILQPTVRISFHKEAAFEDNAELIAFFSGLRGDEDDEVFSAKGLEPERALRWSLDRGTLNAAKTLFYRYSFYHLAQGERLFAMRNGHCIRIEFHSDFDCPPLSKRPKCHKFTDFTSYRQFLESLHSLRFSDKNTKPQR